MWREGSSGPVLGTLPQEQPSPPKVSVEAVLPLQSVDDHRVMNTLTSCPLPTARLGGGGGVGSYHHRPFLESSLLSSSTDPELGMLTRLQARGQGTGEAAGNHSCWDVRTAEKRPASCIQIPSSQFTEHLWRVQSQKQRY